MKTFLALFVAPVEAYDKMKERMKTQTPEEQKADMEGWNEWMERNKAHVVDAGNPVGAAKHIAEGGAVSDTRNEVGGYMIVQAETHDAAAEIFKDAPLFGLEGGGIDVMEIVEM